MALSERCQRALLHLIALSLPIEVNSISVEYYSDASESSSINRKILEELILEMNFVDDGDCEAVLPLTEWEYLIENESFILRKEIAQAFIKVLIDDNVEIPLLAIELMIFMILRGYDGRARSTIFNFFEFLD